MSSVALESTIVLVHGAWADGSCWDKVILPLRKAGLKVTCAPIPLTSLTEDIAALERVIERTHGPIVLVGHAYAGAVIAGPKSDRIQSLVYIAALAPAEAETVADVFYRAKAHPQAPQLQPDAHGLIWMPEGGFARAVAHTASPDQNAILEAVSAGLVVAGDAAYNDVHLYLAESNAETHREWIVALDTIESLKPRAVIAGHKKPGKDDSPRIIEETRQYIRDFDRLAGMTTTTRELYDKMLEIYPNRANPGSLWGSVRVAKP
jgi:pimeloyl-ACP methyl ester carboxylesterase